MNHTTLNLQGKKKEENSRCIHVQHKLEHILVEAPLFAMLQSTFPGFYISRKPKKH